MSIRGGVLLVGVPTFLWASTGAFAPPPPAQPQDTAAYLAYLRENHGFVGLMLGPGTLTRVPAPAPAATIGRPLAALTTDGALHVVWAGPASALRVDPDAPGPRVVWHAERRGDEWGVPRALFTADHLHWASSRVALLTRGTDVHILVPYFRVGSLPRSGGGIAYLRRIGGRWRETAVRAGLPPYVTAQFSGADSLVVAFAATDTAARVRNGSHVFVTQVAVHDTTWPAPRRVQWSGLSAAAWPKLFRVSSRTGHEHRLVLLWGHVPPGAGAADTVYAMTSDDEGVTWASPTGLQISGGVQTTSIAADGAGAIHVVALVGPRTSAQDGTLLHAYWSDGRWSPADPLPFGPVASQPTLSPLRGDTLLLSWGRAERATKGLSPEIAPVGQYALLVRQCAGTLR